MPFDLCCEYSIINGIQPDDGMKTRLIWMTLLVATMVVACRTSSRQKGGVLSLYPREPRYLQYQGAPLLLITSGEHYGAVLNRDFDYVKYLETLAADGMNGTRTFSGSYVEPEGAFHIARNTLAPTEGRFICPWKRSDVPGYANGGNKFNLDQWDRDYFARLKDFMRHAEQNGIIVELVLFCPFYGDSQWDLSPMNARNNVNGLGQVARTNVFTLDQHGGLLAVQEKLTRKLVEELNSFGNLYFEICNEPYFGGVTLEWQHHIADLIVATEKRLPHRHLISRNVANGSARVENPHPAVSIFNFHYAHPPDAVAINAPLRRVVGDNETGFRGTDTEPYRIEAWDFILAGGGLFNHLDYSFTVGHEDGRFEFPRTQPGSGGPEMRRQLRELADFMNEFDFTRMKPAPGRIHGDLPPGVNVRVLADEGECLAAYISPNTGRRDDWSVRWTATLRPRFTEDYTFFTRSNDGVRLWLDGNLIIDNWTEHTSREDSAVVPLRADQVHELKLEYFQAAGPAEIRLEWASASQLRTLVADDQLMTPDGKPGLRAEFFEGTAFGRKLMERTDDAVDFVWSEKSPFDAGRMQRLDSLALEFPSGEYQAEWLDPATGRSKRTKSFRHEGGVVNLICPPFQTDLALRILRQ